MVPYRVSAESKIRLVDDWVHVGLRETGLIEMILMIESEREMDL